MKKLNWSDPRLMQVTAVVVTDMVDDLYWEVVEVQGVSQKREQVLVDVPFDKLVKYDEITCIIKYAQADYVYADSLGMLDPGVIRVRRRTPQYG